MWITPATSKRFIWIVFVYSFIATITKQGLFVILIVRIRLSFTDLFNFFSAICISKCNRSYSSLAERTFLSSSALVKPLLHASIAKSVIAAIRFSFLCKVFHAYDTLLLLTFLGLL